MNSNGQGLFPRARSTQAGENPMQEKITLPELRQKRREAMETLINVKKNFKESDESRIVAMGLEQELDNLDAAIRKKENGFDGNGHIVRALHGNQAMTTRDDPYFDDALCNFSLTRAIDGAAGMDVDWGRDRELDRKRTS